MARPPGPAHEAPVNVQHPAGPDRPPAGHGQRPGRTARPDSQRRVHQRRDRPDGAAAALRRPALVEEGWDSARGALLRRFHLADVGSDVGDDLAAQGALVVGEIEHSISLEQFTVHDFQASCSWDRPLAAPHNTRQRCQIDILPLCDKGVRNDNSRSTPFRPRARVRFPPGLHAVCRGRLAGWSTAPRVQPLWP